MYLRVFKEDIIDGIIKATGIISQKTGAAYLRTLWLSSNDDKISIMSTDSNVEFTGNYNANVLEKGLVGVEGKKFSELIRKLKPGEIILKVDNDQNILHIQQDKRRYKIPTSDSSWFPELEEFPEEKNVLWSGEIFREIIDKTFFCVSEDNTMGSLTCLKISKGDPDKTEIEICAFDMQNMGLYTLKDESIYNIIPDEGMLIPRKYLTELRKWLTFKEIEISVSKDRFFIRTEDMKESISFPLSFDEFSDYQSIINSFIHDINSCLVVNRKDLLESLDRILIFSTELNRATAFELSSEELRLVSTAAETGEADEVIPCSYDGNINEMVFNIKSMMEILGHLNSEEIQISLCEKDRPCKVTGTEDRNFFVVTMPVQVEEEVYYTEEEDN
ncbi:MAG: DNA polymerase III subunit beta [Desulfonatronovibrio sp.]